MKFYYPDKQYHSPTKDEIIQAAIKPIETIAFNHRFRSRLEARWATFFEYLDIRWEYEKEGYTIEDIRYLPDFFLPYVGLRNSESLGVWIEIKPLEYKGTGQDTAKYLGLYKLTGYPLILFKGIPEYDSENGFQHGDPHGGEGWWDNYMAFFKCENPNCNYIKIEFLESNYQICPKCRNSSIPYHQDILLAINAAKQARFEFGEKG